MTDDRAAILSQYYGALGDARETVYYAQWYGWSPGNMRFTPAWDKVSDTPEFRAEEIRVGPLYDAPLQP